MRLTSKASVVLFSMAVAAGASAPSAADVPLARLLESLLEPGVTLDPSGGHPGHFVDPQAVASIQQINAAIASQFSTYPVVSSSGGFSYTFDPATGVEARASDSFGPLFAERALTLGKGKLNIGALVLHSRYDSFEGLGLRDGSLDFTFKHEDEDGDGRLTPWFEGDVIDGKLDAGLTLDTTLLFATWGAGENVDLSIAVPLVRAELDARLTATVVPLATGSGIHSFAGGRSTNAVGRSETATGIGDVVLRAKVRFHHTTSLGMAFVADVRLPTGDDMDLLGTGQTQAKLGLIGSGKVGNFWPHLNVAYARAFGSSDVLGDLPDELDYTAGFDVALSQRVTFATDILGRTFFDAARLGRTTNPFQFNQNPSGPPNVGTVYRQELVPYSGDLTTVDGALGLKINTGSAYLVNLAVLFPLDRGNGLESDLSIVAGLDYTF